jgi:hypothetical protein
MGSAGEPPARPPEPPGGLAGGGGAISPDDMAAAAAVLRSFTEQSLLPRVEERMARLNISITGVT